MLVDGEHRRAIWRRGEIVSIIDQTVLPHALLIRELRHLDDAAVAIRDMQVRGAPLIGVTAAYGIALSMRADPSSEGLDHACGKLRATRPTAVNLAWALEEMRGRLRDVPAARRADVAYAVADDLAEADVELCRAIGRNGLELLRGLAKAHPGRPLNVLTHCNAGWLATVDWGTATAPIYAAQAAGLPIHVYVDETRPRNQGASLTAWELGQQSIPHTIVVDNVGGHLMQHGLVDCVIVGTDRTTAKGDVCNKIGTYLKALAAHANGVPFYVAAPSPSIDFSIDDGLAEIPIEQRGREEVTHIFGRADDGRLIRVQLTPDGSAAANYAFDVTPAELVTGLITERGVVSARRDALAQAFPERVLSRTRDRSSETAAEAGHAA